MFPFGKSWNITLVKFDSFKTVLSLLCMLSLATSKTYFNILQSLFIEINTVLFSTIIVNWCVYTVDTSVVISEIFVYDFPCPNRETVKTNSVLLVDDFICNGKSTFLGVSFFPLCTTKNKSRANDNDSRFTRSDFGDGS